MVTTNAHRTLQRGSVGGEVTYLQTKLRDFYRSGLLVDGDFGPQTEAQVERFQSDCAIAVDGIVGSNTWRYLDEITPYAQAAKSTVRKGSIGNEVKYLQVRLNNYHSGLQVDGMFGAVTEAQVKRYQTIYTPHAVDGIVGSVTWSCLDEPNLDI